MNILTISAINMVRVFSLPPGCDASPLQRYLQVSICWYRVLECRKAVFCPSTQRYFSGQSLSLCHSISSPMLAIRPPRVPRLYRSPFFVAGKHVLSKLPLSYSSIVSLIQCWGIVVGTFVLCKKFFRIVGKRAFLTTVEPLVNDHPKCQAKVVAYGRESLTRA